MTLVVSLCGCGMDLSKIVPLIIDSEQSSASEENQEENQEESRKEVSDVTTDTQEDYSYPTEFDLSDLYASIDDWNADYEKCKEIIDSLDGRFRGKLNNAEEISAFFDDPKVRELDFIFYKLYKYASLSSDVDQTDGVAADLLNKAYNLNTYYSTKTSFASAEIMAIPLEEREAIFADEIFDPYRISLRSYYDPKSPVYTENENVLIATFTNSYSRADAAAAKLRVADSHPREYTLSDNTVIRVDEEAAGKVKNGEITGQEAKDIEELYYLKSGDTVNTNAVLLQTHIMEEIAYARTNGFDSVLERSLYNNMVEPQIYENNVKSANSILDDYHRYFEIHKKGLGVSDMIYLLTFSPIAEYNGKCSYDEAVAIFENAISVLSDEYINEFDNILRSGHVDVYPKDNKVGGAYETSVFNKKVYPFVLTNFSGYIGDASTLAHEMGHAMYARMSEMNDDIDGYVKNPSNFTHEVASITNEFLVLTSQYNNAKDDEEKLYFLEKIITLINGSVLRQTMYEEFEDYCYKEVEAGGTLSEDKLNEKWMELNKTYFGDAVDFSDNFKYYLTEISHFYLTYYVYNCSTSSTYAAIIANRIVSGDEEQRDAYLEMLSLGCSKKPSELLQVAGVDPLDENVYAEFAKYYKSLIDEYEELVEKK